MLYKHTQIGIAILAVVGGVVLLMLLIWLVTSQGHWIVSLTLAGMILITLLFGTLTVEINEERLVFWFGIGLIRQEFALEEIKEVQTVRNPWFYGWGIRHTPRGWLYNVSGFEAVEITLSSGKHFRLGTDQPQRLAAMLSQGK